MKSKIFISILLFYVIAILPQKDIKIISSSFQSLEFEYNPIITDSSTFTVNDIKYKKLSLYLGNTSECKFGSPQIHQRFINIGVPSEFGNTIQVLTYSYKEIEGRLNPTPRMIKKNGQSQFIYSENEDYTSLIRDEDLVIIGEYGIARGLKVQTLKIKPIFYNPINNTIRIYTKIVVKINFDKAQLINSNFTDDFSSSTVINYGIAKNWMTKSSQLSKPNLSSSVLSTGKWYRFEAPEEGFYKITKSMLSQYGIDANTVDPRTIKIYNNGGRPVPENVTQTRFTDLVENAILVSGEADGKFDDADYILFYGRGINFWTYDTLAKKYLRNRSYFSKENYYWITSGGKVGKRIENQSGLTNTNPIVQENTIAFVSLEEDKINIGSSGRQFFGDDFTYSMRQRTYNNRLEGILPSSTINYHYSFINASEETVPFSIEENGTKLLNTYLLGLASFDYTFGVRDSGSLSFIWNLPTDRSLLKFLFNPTSSSSFGYLDYFEINYKRDMKYGSTPFIFFSQGQNGIVEYRISNLPSSNTKVFNITDFSNVKLITNPIMQSGGEYRFQSTETSSKVAKYLVIEGETYKTPSLSVEMKNQNLQGISQGAKFIIITHKNFKEQAERLKSHKEQNISPGISTIVIDCDDIFNEFSCGMKDISGIRDFIRYAYNNWQIKPEYVLLFGDGDYDYKNIENNNKNFVPAFETEESLNEISSFCSDDFYVSVDGNDFRVDLSIGRLNVQTLNQAKAAVDKIIYYETLSEKGLWQNLITLVADDSYTSSGGGEYMHTSQSEELSSYHIPKSFDQNKVYLAAYPTVQTSLGRRKPTVNQAIIDAINSGTILLNFIGHGAPNLWAHEQVFIQSTTIPQLSNNKYFFLTAATCDFGLYDRPNNFSAAEELVLKSNSGAIGTFSATRPVYSDQNSLLNNAFYDRMLFSPRDTLELPIPIGKALYLTKQDFYGDNDIKYNLLGDPTIRIHFPNYTASIDSVNGRHTLNDIQLKALSKVNVIGKIIKNNSLWNNFIGHGILTVYDSERELPLPEFGPNYKISVQGGVIFKGAVSVNNGIFSAFFNVPKDISYENKNGKIVFQFFSSSDDGLGFTDRIKVGGTDSSVIDDKNGPKIEILFDKLDFDNTYLVNPNSTLIVSILDETGINTTGTGLGHKMEGILDNDENNPIDFTRFFAGDLDAGGKSGKIQYKLSNVSEGEHKISVKVWDIFNNPTSEIAYFKVVSGDALLVDYVMNYPNPFALNTVFTFQHNFNNGINARIKIYTVAGRLIKELERKNILDDRFVRIEWDGRDNDGNLLANGTYLYKLIVESIDGKQKQTSLSKLAIIR
jgi:hypothetical protein